MTDPAYLAYIPDPFGTRTYIFMLLEPDRRPRTVSTLYLSKYSKPIISYNIPDLVEDLRRIHREPPPLILDIVEMIRLRIGQRKDDLREDDYNIWVLIQRYLSDREEAVLFERIVSRQVDMGERSKALRLLRKVTRALQLYWNDLSSELEASNDLDRVQKIEWPLQGVFAYRQCKGIAIDTSKADDILLQIQKEKYLAFMQVARLLNRNPSGLTFWNIHPYLEYTDVSYLQEISPGNRLQDAFELATSHSKFARDFLTFSKSSRDESVVKRSMSEHTRVHPIFRIFATVTSRISVTDPNLQQLRRAYRSLVLPDRGSRLIYLDYAQFEPGVFAGLVSDDSLVEAYNSGDVYSALADALFCDSGRRPLAKRVYLAFSYGMSPARIAKLLLGDSGSGDDHSAYMDRIRSFFDDYIGIEEYRRTQQKQLVDEGFVSSVWGNRRYRRSRGGLTAKEARWSINHRVQSTASLIFKEALIDLVAEFGRQSILLPVHDAVLLQFDDDAAFDEKVRRSREIMRNVFTRRFSAIDVNVVARRFDSEVV